MHPEGNHAPTWVRELFLNDYPGCLERLWLAVTGPGLGVDSDVQAAAAGA
jgi:hypothetical protein